MHPLPGVGGVLNLSTAARGASADQAASQRIDQKRNQKEHQPNGKEGVVMETAFSHLTHFGSNCCCHGAHRLEEKTRT